MEDIAPSKKKTTERQAHQSSRGARAAAAAAVINSKFNCLCVDENGQSRLLKQLKQ